MISDIKDIDPNIKKEIYLHFLDRELLNSVSAYDTLSEHSVVNDLRLLLFSCYETAYFSTSLLFENKFARRVFDIFPDLFQYGIIELARVENSLQDFVLSKREQYPHARKLYKSYFDDTYKIISDKAPNYRDKKTDTTKQLEKSLIMDLSHKGIFNSIDRFNFQIDPKEIYALQPYIIDSLKNRQRKAVTKLLFENSYRKFKSSYKVIKSFNVKISEHYIQAYLDAYSGTIATGLSSGVNYFSYLCPTYPFHHLPIYKEIYKKIGCFAFILNSSQEQILAIRTNKIFEDFISEIKDFIYKSLILFNHQEKYKNQDFDVFIRSLIRTVIHAKGNSPKHADEFIKIIESVKKSTNDFDYGETFESNKSKNNNFYGNVTIETLNISYMQFNANNQDFKYSTFNDFKEKVVQNLMSNSTYGEIDKKLVYSIEQFGGDDTEKQELLQALVQIKSDKSEEDKAPFRDKLIQFFKKNKKIFGTVIKIGLSNLLDYIGIKGAEDLLDAE